MTHPAALAISIALTLMLGFGVIAGRDRLFEATADAGSANVASISSVARDATTSGAERQIVGISPRVIEIPRPTTERPSTLRATDDEGEGSRGGDNTVRSQRDDEGYQEESDD